jgi:NAD(P)-dependent dehydrogenase (short-subunit alcohol dehydrogenase family)
VNGQLRGKTAIVTGAASGIGRATAALFAARGAAVLAVDRDEKGLGELRDEVAATGGELAVLAVDLTAAGAAEQVFDHCAEVVGSPNVLANIAGKAGDRSAAETSDEDFEFFLRTNLGTTFALSRRAVTAFGDGGGAIVNTSSTFALTGVAGSAPYSAAKGAVSSLTRQMADRDARPAGEDRGGRLRRPGDPVASAAPGGTADRRRQGHRVPGLGRGGVRHRAHHSGGRRLEQHAHPRLTKTPKGRGLPCDPGPFS